MAKYVFLDAVVTVGGTDISDHVSSVSIDGEYEEVDVTGLGAEAHEILKGLLDATIELEVFQDFASGEIDQTIWALFQTTTPFVVAVRTSSAAISATNPEYQLTALLFSYSPISANVGEASSTTLTLRNADQAGLVRDITP